MAKKILYNGKIISDQLNVSADSAVLNYGSGFFETILYEQEKLYFFQEHLRRLEATCSRLNLDFDLTSLSPAQIISLIKKNNDEDKCLRVKILYLPLSGEWDTIVYTRDYHRPENALTVCSHYERRECQFANYKTTNYFENIYWKSLYANRYKADEFLYRNHYGNFIEGSSTNLFCVKDGILYCPDPENDYLKGILQMKIIKNHRAIGFTEVIYKRYGIRENLIRTADEVFLTNSLMIASSIGIFHDTTRNRSFKLMGRRWAKKIRQFFLAETPGTVLWQ